MRDDIATNLRLKPTARKWVQSFERPNLHFSVQRKQGQLGANFRALLAAGERAVLRCAALLWVLRCAMRMAARRGPRPRADAPRPPPPPTPHSPPCLAAGERNEVEPTIIYVLTKREAAEIAAELAVRGVGGVLAHAWGGEGAPAD